ncbi:response regulator [Carboxylicivirga sp. N1Y90]|uniref:response regulator n=1 Tax=Carboxylicivirga fragile TaxID=3417571 RepID=UPI003D34FBD4|nr:response regulator [Marinilabiliaceae bacterium N1Y90]
MTIAKQKVLIVDDTPENISLISNALSDRKRIAATNGSKAIELALQHKPDLILLDIIMPEMDGFEVCRILKSNQETKDIPVIFITAETETESIVKGFEVGGIDYVTKPINVRELQARVKTQLALKTSMDDNIRYIAEIDKRNKQITDSINYAHLIQKASLPSKDYLKDILPKHFVYYGPRDIVSGDFYWAKKVEDKTIVIAADCTGHGVPGAFLSMYGIAFLNEIVLKDKITEPDQILNRMRETVIQSLNQGEMTNMQDGMDMVVLTINSNFSSVDYAGANNPLWILRGEEMLITRGDTMPIGKHVFMNDFTKHTVPLIKGDQLYIFSDGYADQFGGPRNRKLMKKNFRAKLIEFSEFELAEQKKKLLEFFCEWQDGNEQIDDTLIISIKI